MNRLDPAISTRVAGGQDRRRALFGSPEVLCEKVDSSICERFPQELKIPLSVLVRIEGKGGATGRTRQSVPLLILKGVTNCPLPPLRTFSVSRTQYSVATTWRGGADFDLSDVDDQ
jgi:hypothetical protein